MRKFIITIMSLLLVVLLIDIGEAQARRGRSGYRNQSRSQYDNNYDYICPAPNSLGPHHHSHYNVPRRNFNRYDDDWGIYFRTAPYCDRYGMTRRFGMSRRHGGFGRHHRYNAPGRGRGGRGGRRGRPGRRHR
jgi:hypothetical protein